jgi:hypothetical protein
VFVDGSAAACEAGRFLDISDARAGEAAFGEERERCVEQPVWG